MIDYNVLLYCCICVYIWVCIGDDAKGSFTTKLSVLLVCNCYYVAIVDELKSGKVDSEDLIHALTTMGEMSKADAQQLVDDAGGKSSFDYAKFVKTMNKKAKGGD